MTVTETYQGNINSFSGMNGLETSGNHRSYAMNRIFPQTEQSNMGKDYLPYKDSEQAALSANFTKILKNKNCDKAIYCIHLQ